MYVLIVLSCFCLFVGVTHGQGDRDVIVETTKGPVRGRSFNVHTGQTINRFHAIPFAKPPVGPLRWMAPEDPDDFEGIYDANALSNVCPQGLGLLAITHPFYTKINEDCLYLNVYTPNATDGAPYPVMVWIHGGGYVGSGNIQYPGYFLASRGVVDVVINYRLNHLGFMSTGDDAAPGNYGILDQIKALEWVRDNIANFGGDPNKVTLFGQSAGASSSGILMLSPLADGLFHQAILESGADTAIWAIYGPQHHPEQYTQQVAAKLDCPTDDSHAMMDCMRQLNESDIRAHGFTCEPGFFCQGFAPVVDGVVIPDTAINLRERGEFNKVPMMAGQCSDDGSPYTLLLVPESNDGGFTREESEELLMRLIDMFSPQFPNKTEEVFEALNFYYPFWPYIDDLDLNRESFNVMITDVGFGILGDYQIKSQSNYTDSYYYILGYRSPQAAVIIPEWLGVPHNCELPYVLGWPYLAENPFLRLDSQILFDIIQWDDTDAEWADFMMDMWTNFAKYGNPTPEPVAAPGNNTAKSWPKWTSDEQNYLSMYENVENLVNYRQKNFAFWREYMTYVSGLDFFAPTNSESGSKRSNKHGMESDEMTKALDKLYEDVVMKALKHRQT